jgi:hypothetical protein
VLNSSPCPALAEACLRKEDLAFKFMPIGQLLYSSRIRLSQKKKKKKKKKKKNKKLIIKKIMQ